METSERMMIVGLCLQGLLANTLWMKRVTQDTRMVPNPDATSGELFNETPPAEVEETFYRPMNAEELTAQREAVYKEALLMADRLDPRPQAVAAEAIARLAKAAFEVLKVYAAGYEEDDMDRIFERVSRWYNNPTDTNVESHEDALIRAVVLGGMAE